MMCESIQSDIETNGPKDSEQEEMVMEVQPFVPQDTLALTSNPGVCGLYNLGNTCYMNSTLQCLLHNFELMKHMQHIPSSDENGISTGIAHYFSKLLKKYWSGEFSVVVPDEFKQQLAKIHSQFDGNGQHDGQELLALFLESLHQERKTMIKSNVSSTEETSKRKRTKSVESVDDGLPNNKRIEINIASSPKQVLTINSFFGKEKKTANVNVLSSEVECDEETTTDHSTKYPQHVCSRLNNGQFLGEAEMTTPLPQQLKPIDQQNFQDITTGIKLKKLQLTKFKQTNVIADLKRIDNESDSSFSSVKLLDDQLSFKQNCSNHVASTESSYTEVNSFTTVFEPSLLYPQISSDCFQWNFPKTEDNYMKKHHQFQPFETLGQNSSSLLCATTLDLAGEPFMPQKLFSLRRSNSIPCLRKNFLKVNKMKLIDSGHCFSDDIVGSSSTNNERNLCETDSNCGLQSISGSRGSLLTKFTNILVEHDTAFESSTGDAKYLDTTSNLRGDISGSKTNGHNTDTTADKLWDKYIDDNQSAIVDIFQGQLESTVVCSKCEFKSVTYEPFMYLSLPVPNALNKCFDIQIIPLNLPAQSFSVYAPSHGKLDDLQDCLLKTFKYELNTTDFSNFVFCETKGCSILEVLESSSRLNSIYRKSRKLKMIECFSITAETPNQKAENDVNAVTQPVLNTSWNSCCICLDEFSDSELLQHNLDTCTILICAVCLQNSVEHYGVESFTCPVCHVSCSAMQDFIPLSSIDQSREVIVTINFAYMDIDNKVQLVSPARLLKTATTISMDNLQTAVNQLLVPCLQNKAYSLVLSTRDGSYCSRCNYPSTCRGCPLLDAENITLHPGDNICCRFTDTVELANLKLNLVDETSPGEQTLTLEMCLSAYTKSEILDDENPWYCPTCCCHQVAEKQLRICRWPDTLIVYIKRFLYHSKNAVKVDDEVLFPMESFNPGAISGTRPNRFKSYNLVACMSHFGGVYSGHYTAHCKHPVTGKWNLYNDENVSEQELSSKDNAGAYVLFYQHNAARNSSLYSPTSLSYFQ